MHLDMVARLWRVQTADPDGNNKETAVTAHWVTDRVDRCGIGFLGRHAMKHQKECHGKLTQIVDV